jgi:transcriptional regulator GlxA family with amidase domain
MAMLTIPGATRLFPTVGANASDPLELGALVGDSVAGRLGNNLHEQIDPRIFAQRMNRWLLERLNSTRVPEFQRFVTAYDTLKRTNRVELAAKAGEVSTRQFERWCRTHVGADPRTLLSLHRLQASIYAVQTGVGDPRGSFSDQPHQTRSWRRWLGTTPGMYSRSELSPMASHFTRQPGAGMERIAHWL